MGTLTKPKTTAVAALLLLAALPFFTLSFRAPSALRGIDNHPAAKANSGVSSWVSRGEKGLLLAGFSWKSAQPSTRKLVMVLAPATAAALVLAAVQGAALLPAWQQTISLMLRCAWLSKVRMACLPPAGGVVLPSVCHQGCRALA